MKMKITKRLFSVVMALMLCFASAVPAYADTISRVIDNADLLSASEERSLASRLDKISSDHDMDIMVAAENDLGGRSIKNFADDLINSNTHSRGGIILLIDMGGRDWYISTNGYGKTVITDAGLDYLSDRFVGYLSDGDYARAFSIFADQVEDFIIHAENGDPYNSGNIPKKPFEFVKYLIIALIVGFITALIITLVMKSKNKSVRFKREANSYVRPGSLNVTESRDLFLYSTVNRTAIPKNDSSSGRSGNGGGGGSF